MIFKRYQERILIRVLFMFLTLSCAALLLVKGNGYVIALLPVIIFQVVDFYNFHRKAQEEVEQFVESIHYRDFSRHFDVKQAPLELQPLRKGFNEINTTFKVISREKETQYQYLQKILELVNTGILSYDHGSGDIGWMNESLKKMLGVPYLKTIHSLERRDPVLYQEILSLRPGQNKIVSIVKDNNTFKTLLAGTAFQTDGRIYKLIAFQDVNEALDETEAKAWQKLLSVMTHEIMNSVAPISSLAETMLHRLRASITQLKGQPGAWEDLQLGIDTIRRRSEGLLKFAETYRNLNKITRPNLKQIFARDLFENLNHLMQPTLEQKNIELEIILKDPDLELEADASLIEQVLINLVVNAIEAVKDNPEPRILLSAQADPNKRVTIKVADNGTGMSQELMENIFIPFFSTKKTGSGIGLSLCKQIMLLHKGNIQVQSIEGEGSAFLLHF
ncbi:MAG: HAMP domain-containing sensor histidine kinase [Bacteroidota bacterium]|nr:HAMP domain-containing sensor histidine kinase [Bacteroidota bacterium]MDP4247664.1 HAMP domain-containing sensor histidine kinase [Bacteroidota bacterium]MDP4254323.1 HAMP domain-containing sensor histidine kinase [Bacteroidota bacterium]MDP4258799.1 HAMP domain-containing sensor histidine kinase [Bacteroidota bacterium]